MRKTLLKYAKRILVVSMVTVMMSSSLTAYGKTKEVTPMNGWRYAKKTANYQVNSTSKKYKNIWSKATGKWIDKGFKWTKKDSSKTTVSSYEDDSASGLKVAVYCNTSYRISDGHIKKNKIMLNRAVFKKYDYTDEQIINVAEHELGHALGLAHNNAGSVSVMNPANRYYTIQQCDVKGMNKRYSTAINKDVVGKDEVTVTEYFYAKIPKITKVKVKYSGKKIYVTGNSKGLKYVTGVYGKVKETSKVDSDKFKIVFAYTDRKDITLSGLNSKKEKISKKKTVKAEKYITDAPVCEKAKKTAKGVRYSVKTVANSTLIFKYNGKIVKKCYIDSSYDTITIKDKVLKGKKGYMKVTQKQKNKRVSKSVKFKILKNDEASQMSY